MSTTATKSALDQAVEDLEQTLLSKSEGKGGATAPIEGQGREHVAGLLETIAKGLKDAIGLFKSTNPSKDEPKGSGKGPASPGDGGNEESGTKDADKSKKGGDLLVSGKAVSEDAPGSGDGKKKEKAKLPEEKEHGGDDKTKSEQESGREPGDPDAGHKTVGKSERELLELGDTVLEPLSREDMVAMLAEALGKSEAEVAALRADVRSLSETIVAVLAPMASATALIVKSMGAGGKVVAVEEKLPQPGVIGTPPKKEQVIAKSGAAADPGTGDAELLAGLPTDNSRNSVLARLTKAVQDEKLPPSILGRFDARGLHALVGIEQDILKSYALPQPAAQ